MKKAAIVIGSLAVTGLLLALALWLGSWGFRQRQASLHVGRLQRLTALHPAAAQVQAGLEAEGARSLGKASSGPELERLSAGCAPASRAAIATAAERNPDVRAFLVGDVVYFLFFDRAGALQDFVVVMPESGVLRCGPDPRGQPS